MLSQPIGGAGGAPAYHTTANPPVGDDSPEGPLTCFFMESLSQGLKMIRSDVVELEDRAAALEDQGTARDEEIEQPQQEVLRLKE
ncbi:hypothetical protein NDU88_010207 [Pleurodeles waltl]|uniref:Uncharacterized protein n=1 Tax=Pleurodeles waltl TaxID=8319 RepID=A0AAV7S0M9_PLEWA|nr:hypothetical protein NDU88_010207 [Pleurodeles waltl]